MEKPQRHPLEYDEEPLPLTLPGVSSVGRVSASRASGDVDEAVASGSSAPEVGAYSWIFGSAPQQAAPRSEVSTFGVVTERDEETADGTKHKRKSMAL